MKLLELMSYRSTANWQVYSASVFEEGIINRLLTCTGTDCTINDVFQSFVRIINLAIQMVGVVMFVLLIYTGYLFLYASLTGSQQHYDKGKKMIGSIWWGFVIIVTAYIVINTIMTQFLNINTWTQPWS